MSKLDRYIGSGVLLATLGVLLLLVGLDALTSVIDETDDKTAKTTCTANMTSGP